METNFWAHFAVFRGIEQGKRNGGDCGAAFGSRRGERGAPSAQAPLCGPDSSAYTKDFVFLDFGWSETGGKFVFGAHFCHTSCAALKWNVCVKLGNERFFFVHGKIIWNRRC